MSSNNVLRLGTRGSLLARTQSQMVADELMRRHAGLRVELVIIKTTGDQVQDKPLADIGGKGLFTKELEQALLAGSVDFAVHSFKDVPVTMPLVDQSDLIIAAVPKREDPRDVLLLHDPAKGAMPHRAKVGTSSLRRKSQVLEFAPDAQVLPVRGNIDTRIRKLRDGEYDVVIMAMAGLKRAGLFDPYFMKPLEPKDLLSAPAQGALAIQCRKSDAHTRELLAPLDDVQTHLAVDCERAIVQALNGDCHSPIAALAAIEGDQITLRAAVAGRDGVPPVVRAEATTLCQDSTGCVHKVIDQLTVLGAPKLLRGHD